MTKLTKIRNIKWKQTGPDLRMCSRCTSIGPSNLKGPLSGTIALCFFRHLLTEWDLLKEQLKCHKTKLTLKSTSNTLHSSISDLEDRVESKSSTKSLEFKSSSEDSEKELVVKFNIFLYFGVLVAIDVDGPGVDGVDYINSDNNIDDMDRSEIQKYSKNILDTYSDDLDSDNFERELIQFQELKKSFLDNNFFQGPHYCVKYIRKMNIRHTFPNLDIIFIILQIYLSMPYTNCSRERSFSVLKRIKNRMRSTLTQEQLDSLSLLTIHHDVTK
ncbi:hypothetical protein QTP88_012454 [Uroleucon formosanum]